MTVCDWVQARHTETELRLPAALRKINRENIPVLDTQNSKHMFTLIGRVNTKTRIFSEKKCDRNEYLQ